MTDQSPYEEGTFDGRKYFYDSGGGCLAVTLMEGQPDHVEQFPNFNSIYWADPNRQDAIGVDILNVLEGPDLSGLPEQDYIRRLLTHLGIPVSDPPQQSTRDYKEFQPQQCPKCGSQKLRQVSDGGFHPPVLMCENPVCDYRGMIQGVPTEEW